MNPEPPPSRDDGPDATHASRPAPLARPRRARGVRWRDIRPDWRDRRLQAVLAGAVAIVALAAVFSEQLGDWFWPGTRLQALNAEGERALAAGRLTAPDGTGARERFEAALAMDPDRTEAHDGLARTARAALAQARRAVDAGRYAEAHQALQLARALDIPRAAADAVALDLRTREAAAAGLDGLLERAATAQREGRLHGDESSALALYGRVLSLSPDDADALRGREDVLDIVLAGARRDVERGALKEAVAAVAVARASDAGHAALPDLTAQLSAARDRLRRRADGDLARGRLAGATTGYRMLLDADASDEAARDGLQRVAGAHADAAERAAADFRFPAAEAALAAARALAPDLPVVAEAESRIARARRTQGTLADGTPARAADRRRVQALLAEAAAAEARGDLLSPPGDSAYDKLRAARALAPNDAAVRRAAARLLPAATECFDRELRGNRLARARACLDARIALEGESGASVAARRRLAQRWLAVGDERLGAGDLRGAGDALGAARRTDPRVPGLEDFAVRLRAASGGG